MPSSRRPRVTPVIVEVQPTAASITTASSPGSPKAVRFAPRSSELVTGVSRPPNQTEAWSLWHFEAHARACPTCRNPYEVQRRGGRLCDVGHSLAQDVAIHVYHSDGEVYSTAKEQHKLVRVEIPHDYDQARALLMSMERGIRSRAPPVISQDRSYYVAPRRSDETESRAEVIIEPSSSKSSRRSKHKSTRYRTIVVEDDVEDSAVRTPRRDEKRGSLYLRDLEVQRKDGYRVEIREPERREKRERRATGFWS